MPKLLLFAPCEKVIIDHDNNTVSLISVFQQVQFQVPDNSGLPEKAALPMQWYMLSMWKKEEGDTDQEFEQRFLLRGENNETILESVAAWHFAPEIEVHRHTIRTLGLPLGHPNLELVLFFRRVGEEWREIATYPFTITPRVVTS